MAALSADAVSAAQFLVRRMYREVDFTEDRRHSAVAETERPFAGDRWFWTDDNAKVLEFLTRRELGTKYFEQAESIHAFLRSMCRGPFIFRRISEPRLEATGRDGEAISYYHSLMHLRYDLAHGYVVAGVRFHDNRTADNLLLSANSVIFKYKNKSYSINVEAAIDSHNASQQGHSLTLRHSSDLYFKPSWRRMRLGRVSYTYRIDARSMLINVETALEVDPNANVADVVLTIGHNHLSHGRMGVQYKHLFSDGPAALRFTAGEPGRGVLPAAGTTYYSIAQADIAGFALAVHSRSRDPGRLSGIETLVQENDKLHFVRSRYRFEGPCRGARLVAAEDKMLTAGGFYEKIDDYAALMREVTSAQVMQRAALDYSVSYDYGAELLGFASYYAGLLSHDAPREIVSDVGSLFDAYLNVYIDIFINGHGKNGDAVSSRQLAFVILAVIVMHRACGGHKYLRELNRLCTVMLDFEKRFEDVAGDSASGFIMGVRSQRIVFVDCHSAALLALTVASQYVDDPRLTAAIDRGLSCYSIETTKIDWHDGPHKIDTIAVDWTDDSGGRHTNHGYWNYHAGLTLRFFAALRRSGDPALQAVVARHRERMELLEMIMRWHIERSLTWHDDAVEIRSSVLSTETNSETQPWAMVGLLERGWV